VPGVTLTGYLSDKLPLRLTILLSCTLATLSCLLLWGFGKTDNLLILFSLAWGLSGLSFVGLWSKVISVICGEFLYVSTNARVDEESE
jgi:MFS family permease